MRHSLEPKQAVDATLIFGTPIVAFGLQAALVRDVRIRHRVLVAGDGRLVPGAGLVDGAAAARPGRGTSLAGRMLRRARPGLRDAGRAAGTGRALDIGGMGDRRRGCVLDGPAPGPLAGPRRRAGAARPCRRGFPGIACPQRGCAVAAGPPRIHWRRDAGLGRFASRIGRASRRRNPAKDGGRGFARLEHGLSPLLFWLGFLWWQYALHSEINRMPLDAQGIRGAGVRRRRAAAPAAAGLGGRRFRGSTISPCPGARRPWPIAATPAYTVLPVMVAAPCSAWPP